MPVIVVEALDRLGRNLADIATLHDRLSFAGIRLHAVSTGEITPMHVGMLGTMAQMYLSDLREKTKRGQLGRALQGRIPGGKAFGYDVVEPRTVSRKAERGERRINEVEAAVVRRIFEAQQTSQSWTYSWLAPPARSTCSSLDSPQYGQATDARSSRAVTTSAGA